MMIPNFQTTRPCNRTVVQWPWATIHNALAGGLPSGAVTVIRLRESDNSGQAWRNTVAELVPSTLLNHRHVAYVPVDSEDPHQPIATEVAVRVGEGGRLAILLDEDHVVQVRDDRGRPRAYRCGIPTMDRVQELVRGWEDDYGPSLVVLDGLERARPYQATAQDLITFSDGITITRRALNEWRALEMNGYASSRPDAPTVVVWNDDGSGAHSEAIQLLCDVAIVVIEAGFRAHGADFLTVSQRTHMHQPFHRQQVGYVH